MKKSITRGLAALLATLLIVPTNVLPASAEELSAGAVEQKASEVTYNPGAGYFTVYDWNSVSGNDALLEGLGLNANDEADVELFQEFFTFDEDGNYTIQAEVDAFFPYEVEFTVDGEKTSKWFDTPDSTVEVGGHTFSIASETTGEQVTGMTLNVAGDTIVVYPEKEFVDEPLSLVSTMSLLPLEEKRFSQIDLSSYTPIELTQVSISALMGSEVTTAEKIAWSYTSSDDNDFYEVNGTADKVDLSWGTYYSSSVSLQLIDNNGQQLNGDATRYILPINVTKSREWLETSAYKKAEDGSKVDLNTYDVWYYDYLEDKWDGDGRRINIDFDRDAVKSSETIYLKLNVNDEIFPNVNYATLKAFAGEDKSTEITSSLLAADTEGYAVATNYDPVIVLEAYDAAGQVIGTMPMELSLYRSTVTEFEEQYLYTASGASCGYSRSSSTDSSTDVKTVTMSLSSDYAVDATYYWKPYYKKDNEQNNSLVTAVYVGTYTSIAEATAAGATDIKDVLFGSQGYGANYSGEGIPFTIFVGADGDAEQEIYKYIIKCASSDASALSSSTYFSIYRLCNESGYSVHTENTGNYSYNPDDSYGDSSYFTYYVDKETDLTKLKMDFYVSDGAKLYAGNTEVKSEETILDFSNSPIQFTVVAEDGEASKNYWVAVYKPVEGAGQLYINSLKDVSAKTEVKDGVVYSTREVMLDYIHDDIHDIMVANLGTQPIANLKVELSADATVALDNYWQLDGQHSLEGFTDSYGYLKNEDGSFSASTTNYGKLWNLAKVRLVKKDGVEDGTDVTGTLTFKSGETTLMVLTLTGTVGDPTIITKEIPAAVKYVPYGVVIQNSNKYSWNTVTYELYDGKLPAGMILKNNGEIYGVPAEIGEYTFMVRMENSSGRFQSRYVYKEFTLVVAENTDANVEAATDEGYIVLDRIPNLDWDAEGDYSIRSNGAFATFQDIYLDGVKLVEGTHYTKSEGSTRVTISSQTLKSSEKEGAHTLGMEFREGATATSEGTLKKAAQNYYLGDGDYDNGGSNDNDNDDSNVGGNGGSSSSDDNDDDDSDDKADSSASTKNAESVKANANAMEISYTVVKGDTLSKIAVRNNITLAELLKLNPQIKNANLIYVGQVINLGNGVVKVADTTTRQEVSGYHTIVKGDCLFTIARKYNIPLTQLIAMNPEIAGQKYIFPNQQIRVK